MQDMATGCLCGSCYVYHVSWDDIEDRPQSVEAETLRDTIDLAMSRMKLQS
jgi:hypothetical protein